MGCVPIKIGIYTLANDAVYDQLVALLNSIECNYSKDVPLSVPRDGFGMTSSLFC
jgi:hypothetical protein